MSLLQQITPGQWPCVPGKGPLGKFNAQMPLPIEEKRFVAF